MGAWIATVRPWESPVLGADVREEDSEDVVEDRGEGDRETEEEAEEEEEFAEAGVEGTLTAIDAPPIEEEE